MLRTLAPTRSPELPYDTILNRVHIRCPFITEYHTIISSYHIISEEATHCAALDLLLLILYGYCRTMLPSVVARMYLENKQSTCCCCCTLANCTPALYMYRSSGRKPRNEQETSRKQSRNKHDTSTGEYDNMTML